MPQNPLSFPLAQTTRGLLASIGVGAATFEDLALHVRRLPYRRTLASEDAYQILREGCGTCSSKHRLLAITAREAGRTDVQLTVGIYRMSEANTPGVGSVLANAGLTYVPEA